MLGCSYFLNQLTFFFIEKNQSLTHQILQLYFVLMCMSGDVSVSVTISVSFSLTVFQVIGEKKDEQKKEKSEHMK